MTIKEIATIFAGGTATEAQNSQIQEWIASDLQNNHPLFNKIVSAVAYARFTIHEDERVPAADLEEWKGSDPLNSEIFNIVYPIVKSFEETKENTRNVEGAPPSENKNANENNLMGTEEKKIENHSFGEIKMR